MYSIRHDKGYYTVFKNGKFFCTADSYREAVAEVTLDENERSDLSRHILIKQ